MKHYLLTWYGLTDLRAALGLETTDGPILSALKTGKFTDVVILAYTSLGKDSIVFENPLRAKWEKWRSADLETRLKLPRDLAQQFVDVVGNTAAGHALFLDWLKGGLTAVGIVCKIQIIPQELKHLNEARGIYHAAASALKLALGDAAEKALTVFVSPGTPVMAYTWALIARANPQYNIAVIASSDPRKAPETIHLPKELLMPVISAPQTAKPAEFDVIIHSLGRERMPIYFGILHFHAAEHIFITTREYNDAAAVLSRLLPPDCRTKIIIIEDPFRPADTRRAIEKQIGKLPPEAKTAVNLTGGTKLMFSGALAACWESGLEPFYFEINHHNIIFIRDGSTVPFIGAKSVTGFFAVTGFDVITQGRWNDQPCREARLDVTQKLWKSRKLLGGLYREVEFRKYNVPWGIKRNPPFCWKWGKSEASFGLQREATLILDGETLPVPVCDDFGQYLGGGWLEEYVFSLLHQLEQRGLIYDLRVGIEVDYANKSRHPMDPPVGEFDCAFTDGKRLWFVECKAGSVKQEHIQKLENNLKTYGGIAARGILVSSFPITPALLKRVQSSTSIRAVHPENLNVDELQKILFC